MIYPSISAKHGEPMAEVQVHEDAIVQPLGGATSANTEILSGNVILRLRLFTYSYRNCVNMPHRRRVTCETYVN